MALNKDYYYYYYYYYLYPLYTGYSLVCPQTNHVHRGYTVAATLSFYCQYAVWYVSPTFLRWFWWFIIIIIIIIIIISTGRSLSTDGVHCEVGTEFTKWIQLRTVIYMQPQQTARSATLKMSASSTSLWNVADYVPEYTVSQLRAPKYAHLNLQGLLNNFLSINSFPEDTETQCQT